MRSLSGFADSRSSQDVVVYSSPGLLWHELSPGALIRDAELDSGDVESALSGSSQWSRAVLNGFMAPDNNHCLPDDSALPDDWQSLLCPRKVTDEAQEIEAISELEMDILSFCAALSAVDSDGVVGGLEGDRQNAEEATGPPQSLFPATEGPVACALALGDAASPSNWTSSASDSVPPDLEKSGASWAQTAPLQTKRPRASSDSEGTGEVDFPSTVEKSRAKIEEERLQKRQAKNRRTARESRERKKAEVENMKVEMKKMMHDIEALRRENEQLKNALEVQKAHTELFREHFASFSRGAMRDTSAATTTEPAALISTVTQPPVHDTSVPRSVSQPSLNQLITVLACLHMVSQAASSVIRGISKLAISDPATANKVLRSLSFLPADMLPKQLSLCASARCSEVVPTAHFKELLAPVGVT